MSFQLFCLMLCDTRPLFQRLEVKVVKPSVGDKLKYKGKVMWKLCLFQYDDQFMSQARPALIVWLGNIFHHLSYILTVSQYQEYLDVKFNSEKCPKYCICSLHYLSHYECELCSTEILCNFLTLCRKHCDYSHGSPWRYFPQACPFVLDSSIFHTSFILDVWLLRFIRKFI